MNNTLEAEQTVVTAVETSDSSIETLVEVTPETEQIFALCCGACCNC